jgi:hypothetical protein
MIAISIFPISKAQEFTPRLASGATQHVHPIGFWITATEQPTTEPVK